MTFRNYTMNCTLSLIIWANVTSSFGQSPTVPRDHILLDSGWRFALGHSYDKDLDFGLGKSSFSYYAKTGYGDGAAAAAFDDRAWRTVDLPHDWAMELPFSRKGTHSHGFKAMGDAFPEHNIGWYRRGFFIPTEDKGRRINIEFGGIFRDAKIWINGFYIGEEHSGYSTYEYDVSAYLHYGDNNVVSVRVDAGTEEGWFYEGAGIYRHVWLNKTAPVHIGYHGTYITSEMVGGRGVVTVRTTVINEGQTTTAFAIRQHVMGKDGDPVVDHTSDSHTLEPGETREYRMDLPVDKPALWSVDTPYLYTAMTELITSGTVTDRYKTVFGIRSVRFSADSGFFLNGKHLFLKGTNNHQDFSGVGIAVPDGLQDYRIEVLKSMGCNAVRCAHNPPSEAFLEACDRLGMLVLDENRLMGTSPEHYQQLSRMILRDRNHPCIFAWSIGNEEWAIEGNDRGASITREMEEFVRRWDPTRRVTAAVSGGRVDGISTVIDVMGYNYNEFGDIDRHHTQFPEQPMMLTEERTAFATRGVYITDSARAHMVPTDWSPGSFFSVAQGMQFCSTRPFMAGIFYWTGFDYHGEPDPFSWPQVTSQFGIVDLCGFPKDQYYYVKGAWIDTPLVRIGTHWNWTGREGQEIYTKVYSNCNEVELFLNGKSEGRKPIPWLGSAVWDIPYHEGVLSAKGYRQGKVAATDTVETTGAPALISLERKVYTSTITGGQSAIVNVSVKDKAGRIVPLADNTLTFHLSGPGRIIGVGNGDPSSHAPEVFSDSMEMAKLGDADMTFITREEEALTAPSALRWQPFHQTSMVDQSPSDTLIVVRSAFRLDHIVGNRVYTYFAKPIAGQASVYLNGGRIGDNHDALTPYVLDHSLLKAGMNTLILVGKPLVRKNRWEEMNSDPGIIQIWAPAPEWTRKTFNGLAQVLLVLGHAPGKMVLEVTSNGLQSGKIVVRE